MFDQVVVGGSASLVNLFIHAMLMGAIVNTVRRLADTDASILGFA